MTTQKSEADSTQSAVDTGQSLLRFRWSHRHTPLGIGAVLVIGVVFLTLGDIWGLVAWGTVLLAWLVFPPVVAFGIGQFSLLGIAGEFVPLLTGELALGLLLLADLIDFDGLAGGIRYIAGSLLAIGLVLGLLQLQGIVAVLAGLVVCIGLVSYELHRYLLRQLGVLYDRENETSS